MEGEFGWNGGIGFGRGAAYGAALALLPYLLIKVVWVVGSLAGTLPVGTGFGAAEWVVLNTVTVGMAGIGVALALALVRPWGMRIPGALVAFCAWVGSGLSASILPFGVLLSTLLGAGADSQDGGDEPVRPVWEGLLVQFSFLGMGLGLALAVPAHLRRRWPQAFTGRVGDAPRAAPPWAAVVGAAVGLVWLYWAAGGTVGIAHPAERTTHGYALGAVSGVLGPRRISRRLDDRAGTSCPAAPPTAPGARLGRVGLAVRMERLEAALHPVCSAGGAGRLHPSGKPRAPR
ncbi:hypothetical protein SMICM17S_02924 [Streptomyces microflavus]